MQSHDKRERIARAIAREFGIEDRWGEFVCHAEGALKALAEPSSNRPQKCPTCDSPDPKLHPAMQYEGEVQLCRNAWHSAVSATIEPQASIALRELVRLKRLKERIEAEVPRTFRGHTGEHWLRVQSYHREKVAAWELAKRIIDADDAQTPYVEERR